MQLCFELRLFYTVGAACCQSPHHLTLWVCRCLYSPTWDSRSQIWTWPPHPALAMPQHPTLPHHSSLCHPLARPVPAPLITMVVYWAQEIGVCPTHHHHPHGAHFAEGLLSHNPETLHCRRPDMSIHQQQAVVCHLWPAQLKALVQQQALILMFL